MSSPHGKGANVRPLICLMRELTDHKINPANDALTIKVLDEPGAGGANHVYAILAPQDIELPTNGDNDTVQQVIANRAILRFQKGPIAEAGVNGITQEALLSVIADRLRSFQAGPYSCRENAIALTHIETALLWLHKRTLDRMRRGVEGVNKV